MEVVGKLCRDHHVFIVGNKALATLMGAPNAGIMKGLLVSGLDYPGGKSQCLKDWAEMFPQYKMRIVIDDTPAQYLGGWDGWAFFTPTEFMQKVVPVL